MKLRLNKRFIEQSINYPKWWRNYSWWGYRNNKDNPLYRLYFWTFKERHEIETMIICDKSGNPTISYFFKEKKCRENMYFGIPLKKLPTAFLFYQVSK